MAISIELYQPPVESSTFANYVTQLRHMINEAFDSQDRSCYGEENIFPGKVIQHDEQLRVNYGTEGLAAVAFDTTEDSSEELRQTPVAIVGIKPWKGKDIDMWKAFLEKSSRSAEELESFKANKSTNSNIYVDPSSSLDWCLSFAASKSDPRYRGKGLVARCIAMLEQHLLDVRSQAVGDDPGRTEKSIVIWLTALGGIGNVEYYQRRGFTLEDLDDAPAGMWGSTAPFKVATMKKVI